MEGNIMKRKAILCYILTAVLCMSLLQVLPEGAKRVSATTEDLILNLRFDGDLTDASGHSYHGTCTYGKITYEKGIFGQSHPMFCLPLDCPTRWPTGH
jgi:hypothetical protein